MAIRDDVFVEHWIHCIHLALGFVFVSLSWSLPRSCIDAADFKFFNPHFSISRTMTFSTSIVTGRGKQTRGGLGRARGLALRRFAENFCSHYFFYHCVFPPCYTAARSARANFCRGPFTQRFLIKAEKEPFSRIFFRLFLPFEYFTFTEREVFVQYSVKR